MKQQHLYAIVDRQKGLVKIGRSVDVGSRVRQFREMLRVLGMSAAALELVGCVPIDAPEVERVVHRALAPGRVKGEWFKSDDPFVMSFICQVITDRECSVSDWVVATAEQRFVRQIRWVRAAALRGEPCPVWQ